MTLGLTDSCKDYYVHQSSSTWSKYQTMRMIPTKRLMLQQHLVLRQGNEATVTKLGLKTYMTSFVPLLLFRRTSFHIPAPPSLLLSQSFSSHPFRCFLQKEGCIVRDVVSTCKYPGSCKVSAANDFRLSNAREGHIFNVK